MRYLFVLTMLLAGCVSVRAETLSEDAKWETFYRYSEELARKRQAHEMTYRESALAALAKIREIDLNEPLLEEFLSHEVLLAGRVERGEITEDEARYLSAKNKRELWERADARDRAAGTDRPNQRPAFVPVPPLVLPAQPPIPLRPQRTTCRPNGLGGVECTTR